MTKNGEKLLNLVETNDEFREGFLECKGAEEMKKFALEYDLKLSDEDLDFSIGKEEIDPEELDAVSGGDACGCFAGGGGGKDPNFEGEKTCVCVVAGFGYTEAYCHYPSVHADMVPEWERCFCAVGGGGKDKNKDQATKERDEYFRKHG